MSLCLFRRDIKWGKYCLINDLKIFFSHSRILHGAPVQDISQEYVAVVPWLSCVWLSVTPWTAVHLATCPSLSPRVSSHSCPLNWWCHLTISSSVVSFSFFLHSAFPSIRGFSSDWEREKERERERERDLSRPEKGILPVMKIFPQT